MQFIPGMGLDAVLEELRRLRRSLPPSVRAPSRGPVSAVAVAEAILSGRFSLTDPDVTDPVPKTVLSRLSSSGFANDLSARMSIFAKSDLRQWPSRFRRQSLGT